MVQSKAVREPGKSLFLSGRLTSQKVVEEVEKAVG
jgi:hypothetical protein